MNDDGTSFDINNILPAGSRVLSNLYPGFPTTTKSDI